MQSKRDNPARGTHPRTPRLRPGRLRRCPVYGGRCREHARWPAGNPVRASGWEISRLKAMLIAEGGESCEQPGCEATTPLELHHVNGDPSDNHPDNLELRCRRHNPRGAGLHQR